MALARSREGGGRSPRDADSSGGGHVTSCPGFPRGGTAWCARAGRLSWKRCCRSCSSSHRCCCRQLPLLPVGDPGRAPLCLLGTPQPASPGRDLEPGSPGPRVPGPGRAPSFRGADGSPLQLPGQWGPAWRSGSSRRCGTTSASRPAATRPSRSGTWSQVGPGGVLQPGTAAAGPCCGSGLRCCLLQL